MENNNKIAYDALCAEEQVLFNQLMRKHSMVAMLAEELGETPPILDFGVPLNDLQTPSASLSQNPIQPFTRGKKIEVRPTEFFRKSLAESTRTYLERMPDKAAPFPEIISALRQGGFEMKNGDAEEQRLRLNLLKSTNFVLIPENTFGLTSEYGKKKGEKRGRKPSTEKTPVIGAKKRGRPKKETPPSEQGE